VSEAVRGPVEIRCDKLTTCSVSDDGETVRLEFLDPTGGAVSLRLSFAHAEAIVMTLPRLLTRAVKRQTGSDESRYVFPLGQWLLEAIADPRSVILTLNTVDGFEATFRVPLETCRALGWTLQHEAGEAADAPDKVPAAPERSELN
jgi:hypothetical protein